MARTTITLSVSVDVAWPQLQRLATWEGVAGIEDLRDPRHDESGDLQGFRFALDTPVGRVDGWADVEAAKPRLGIFAEQKGMVIVVEVVLADEDRSGGALARVDVSAQAKSFLAKPLAATLNGVLASSIDGEAERIASRIEEE